MATKPTLVFLHEGLGCVSLWRDWPDRLAAATGLAAFVYSRRGYGRSVTRQQPWPLSYLEDEAVVLLGLLEAVGIDQAILLGHSDGGSIALAAAALDSRQVVKGLVLYAPHVTVEPENVAAITATGQRYEQSDLALRLARYHDDVDSTFHGWFDTWTDPRFAEWSLLEHLSRIDVDIAVIQGLADPYGSSAQAEAIAAGVGREGLVVALLADCGHAPHQDRPERTLAASVALIRRVCSAR